MQKKNFFLFIAFLPFLAFVADPFTLLHRITAKADLMTTDNLGNFYLVKNDVLEKYDGGGTLLKTYSNKSFGKIDFVDATNPMKILVFYRNFSQVIFLDNTLSLNGEPVSLEPLGYRQPPLVCASFNNGIWLYNPQNFELVRLDRDLRPAQSTGNISLTTGSIINPAYLMEYNNRVFLGDTANGILIFDVYGTYSKTLPVKGINSFQASGDNIIYLRGKKIMSYNMKTFAEDSIPLPDTSALALRIEKDRLFLLGRDHLNIYSVTNK